MNRSNRARLAGGRGLLALAASALLGCPPATPAAQPTPTPDATPASTRARSGGDTTVINASPAAFAQPAPNMSAARSDDHFVGNSLFNKNWIVAPGTAKSRDGLGPLFNARSCSACHFKDGRGRAPTPEEPDLAGLLFKIGLAGDDGSISSHPLYGSQFQDRAIEGVAPEGRVQITYQEVAGTYADGSAFSLRAPTYRATEPGYGPFGEVRLAPRVAPQVFGVGLLERIPAERLRALADPEDADGDGISGRVSEVTHPVTGQPAIGRFGWKAEQPGVDTQTAAAFNGDLGITSPIFAEVELTPAQAELAKLPDGGAPEVEPKLFDAIVFYARTLAVPARRQPEGAQVLAGERLFAEVGCAACHTPTHTTNPDEAFPELSAQTFAPYTDLLLHDLGPELADGFGPAEGREWRTPPLWGIGLIKVVNGHQELLHDGRARGVAEAILWHGGEAEAAREAFRELDAEARAALIAFVEDL